MATKKYFAHEKTNLLLHSFMDTCDKLGLTIATTGLCLWILSLRLPFMDFRTTPIHFEHAQKLCLLVFWWTLGPTLSRCILKRCRHVERVGVAWSRQWKARWKEVLSSLLSVSLNICFSFCRENNFTTISGKAFL